MSVPMMILAIAGTLAIFGFAAWAGPKVIRAMFPEEQHESMIKAHRVMVIVALVMLVLGVGSALFAVMQR